KTAYCNDASCNPEYPHSEDDRKHSLTPTSRSLLGVVCRFRRVNNFTLCCHNHVPYVASITVHSDSDCFKSLGSGLAYYCFNASGVRCLAEGGCQSHAVGGQLPRVFI